MRIFLNRAAFFAWLVLPALLIMTDVRAQSPVANFTATPLSGCSPVVVTFQDLSTGSPTSWFWDFGNGNTSTLQNPTASYFSPGNYTIRLTVSNARGQNTLTRTEYIAVYEAPQVSFSADVRNGCFPLRVQFTDLSTAGAGNTNTSWQWDFGDGHTSTEQNPRAVYTSAGNYNVTLRVTNDKGCSRTVSLAAYITVTAGVTAGFTYAGPTVCQPPATVDFTNTSTGPGTLTYQWFFGDGNTSTQTSPSHTYTTSGSYTATLVATSSSGCEDTARTANPIRVGGYATSFTSPASACANSPVSFTNTSSPAPSSVSWDFGDGNTSTIDNPVHVYAGPGTYTVTLTSNYGNCTESFSAPIVINALPVADFTAPVTTRCQPPLTVNFQDLTPGATSWEWDFGDGSTSTEQNPAHTYTAYGSYTVTLVVRNANGCADTISRPGFVRIQQPVISIPGLPTRGCIPYTITPVPAITTLDAVTSYQWDFGDGNTSTDANPVHTYTNQGTYTVQLTITTSTGCTETLTIPGAVRVGSKPVADFSAVPIPVCAYQPVQFTDLSVPADEWLWTFGDGSSSTLQNPSHTYADTGYYSVTLIATNNGCPDTITRENYIRVLPPIARFTAAPDCSNRLQFTFTDQSIAPVSWLWDFGDGTTSSVQNPVHTFPSFGSFTVTLTVTNGDCSHSLAQIIYTIRQTPDFTASATTICRGNSVLFTPTGIDPALTSLLSWDFGNGQQLNGPVAAVPVTYPQSGTFTVSLVVTDIYGCTDQVIKNDYIRVNGPVAGFSASNVSGCTGLTTTFTDASTTDGIHALTSWRWDFGDGVVQSFTSPPFQHTYNTPGTFNVKMVVTDASGCSDSLTLNALVTATRPVPDFVSPDTLTCPGAPVQFTNTTVATGFSSFWDLGDGTTTTETSPVHAYAATGEYTIRLYITDAAGCSDSAVKTAYIRVEDPVASFTVNDSIGSCTPLEVHFTNTSTHYSSVQWDFGAGQGSSTINNPVHYYNFPGTYRVKLTITSPGGCVDSAFINIRVEDTTGSRVSYLPLAGCNPMVTDFTVNTPITVASYFWDFGDGNISSTTVPSVSHTYTSFGNFLPKLILQDPAGCLIPIAGPDTIRITGANVNFGNTPTVLCDQGQVTFSDSTTANVAITGYSWDFGDGGSSTDQNPVHTYTAPGSYDVTLTVYTDNNCPNSYTIPAAVKVVASPAIDIGGDTATCVNQSLLHTGIFIQPDTSAVSWAWTFPNGNTATVQEPPAQTYTTAGSFTVTATAVNSSGCRSTVSQPIIVHPLPTVSLPGQMTIQSGAAATIPATYSAGVNSWTWTPSTNLSCSNCATPEASPRVTTRYDVSFSDNNGCRNTGSITIVVVCMDGNLFMPNTFSPNGDGSNDRFYPRGKGLYLIKTLRIFNRWGEVVFEKRDFPPNSEQYGWDGTYKGRKAQADVYVYQVEVICNNGETMRMDGNIALIQ